MPKRTELCTIRHMYFYDTDGQFHLRGEMRDSIAGIVGLGGWDMADITTPLDLARAWQDGRHALIDELVADPAKASEALRILDHVTWC